MFGSYIFLQTTDAINQGTYEYFEKRSPFLVCKIDDLVKSIKMAKEKVPYTRFSVWPGLK